MRKIQEYFRTFGSIGYFFALASILTSLNTWSKNYIYIEQIFNNFIYHTQDEENRTSLDRKFTNS